MSPLAYLALLGWIPLVITLFALVPGRRAAAAALVGAWLFLPPSGMAIAGLPDFTKMTAATIGIMLGTLIFDPGRILTFRPRWFDLPMLLWCCTALVSSLQNVTLYDGLSGSFGLVITWGLPYFLGRLYFGDPDGLRLFAVAMIIGALAYVPLCLWEIRMSPHLLRTFYGIGDWQGIRLGGYRPYVFFKTGLELGLWMTAGSLVGWWLWWCGVVKNIGRYPFGSVLLPVLLITTLLCRSTGSLALLACGMTVLWLSVRFQTRLLLVGLLLVGPLYVAVRVPNLWSGQQAVDWIESSLGHERAYSLWYRFMCEKLLITKAIQRPIFGWGGWARRAVYFANTGKMVETDGMWIIYLGTKGFFGLTLFYLSMALPAIRFLWQFPARLWRDPRVAVGAVAAVLLGLYMVDCLLNGFVNIIYVTLAGGLIALEPKQLRMMAAGTGKRAVDESSIAMPPIADQLTLADRKCKLGRA